MSISSNETTKTNIRPGMQIESGLEYFFKIIDNNDLLPCFQMTPVGCGLVLRSKEKGETIKPLVQFTLDVLRKIAARLGFTRQKCKMDYIKLLSDGVQRKAAALLNKSTARKLEQKQRIRDTSIIVLRFIGIVFHCSYSSIYANLNDCKKRKEFESGVGANNERFYEEVASIVNDNESMYHKTILPAPVPDDISVLNYDKYMSLTTIDDEAALHPLDILNAPVDWNTLKSINRTLHRAFRLMKQSMEESGSHDSDPYNYTGAAIGKCAAVATITHTNLYYFYVQMCFNKQLCVANQVTIPKNLQNSSVDMGNIVSNFRTPKATTKRLKQTSSTDTAGGHQLKEFLSDIKLLFNHQVETSVVANMTDQGTQLAKDVRSDMDLQAKFYELYLKSKAENEPILAQTFLKKIAVIEKALDEKYATMDYIKTLQRGTALEPGTFDIDDDVDDDDSSSMEILQVKQPAVPLVTIHDTHQEEVSIMQPMDDVQEEDSIDLFESIV